MSRRQPPSIGVPIYMFWVPVEAGVLYSERRLWGDYYSPEGRTSRHRSRIVDEILYVGPGQDPPSPLVILSADAFT